MKHAIKAALDAGHLERAAKLLDVLRATATAATGYRVLRLDRSIAPYPPSNDKQSFKNRTG